ncbi:oxysterol-binding protein-related protein 2A-like isoform X1 [Canna indica]|uniref:Oxysterol-binding protein-related protein 2A-like isoform X1 n=1 Tax=Canna indica TaxID=4628 RepID=A0AAQ3JS73_9LILI|nr:oxysterol-binding protein-related protein 2A-like isoform X1 [Canna indica]
MSSPRAMMHPLCCIVLDRHSAVGDRSPDPPTEASRGGGAPTANGEDVTVAGVLYKWTNYGRGWRSFWFSLRRGVLSYSKIRPRDGLPPPEEGGVRVIGDACARFSSRVGGGKKAPTKPVGVVYLKVSSFRESKSDDRRFYIFSRTKTLHLRTHSEKDRVAWIEALVVARSVYSFRTLSERISSLPNGITFSTERLRDRLCVEGLREDVIKDCEHIVLSEFSEYHRQLKRRYEEHLNFLGTVQQQLEEINTEDEETNSGDHLQLMKTEFSCSGHGKYSEYSTTESSDDVEKQETDDLSDDDEPLFFDTNESFRDISDSCALNIRMAGDGSKTSEIENNTGDLDIMQTEELSCQVIFPHIERRKKLPEPIEKEKSISLWSLIKDNVGKDLTRVCLPVYFNEPLSSLQKCFEELEYSYLLDQAYEYGRKGNSLMRILKVAAFAVSAYASSIGRMCKPFNPLLGETYEADFPEKGVHFVSEKVSHHPMLIACHCEGRGWKFWGDSNLTSKFWGQSIQLDPVGVLTLEFDDGEIFQWSKVTTTIYNLIFGKLYCEHHGTMNIRGNRQFSCQLKFKEKSFLDRNPRQVQGFVEDVNGAKVASLVGKWDDSMYCCKGNDVSNKACNLTDNACLLWKRNAPPANPTRYNLTSFAITLNELTSELKEKLPPTDSRLRPDQRHLENGEYQKANTEKLRLEQRQRMSRKLQENGWKPRWFRKEGEDGTYRYAGGYWEAREQKKWDDCPNIFGEV